MCPPEGLVGAGVVAHLEHELADAAQPAATIRLATRVHERLQPTTQQPIGFA